MVAARTANGPLYEEKLTMTMIVNIYAAHSPYKYVLMRFTTLRLGTLARRHSAVYNF